MLHSLKQFAKGHIKSYLQARAYKGSLVYFENKAKEYLSIHTDPKPLPLDYKEEILAYWGKLLNPKGGGQERLSQTLDWHRVYYNVNVAHPRDVAYTDNAFYYLEILPYFNDKDYINAFMDKNCYDIVFSKFNQPKTLIKRIKSEFFAPDSACNSHTIIDQKRAISIIKSYEKSLIKPTRASQTGHGSNIQIISGALQESEIVAIFATYKGDFIVQEVIKQHSYLDDLNANSVNTFRIMTFLYRGKIFYLPSTLLIGGEGITSNGGNYRIGITDSGALRDFIIKGKGELVATLPNLKSPLKSHIPHFQDVLEMAGQMHLCIPQIGIIGWDFSIDSDGNPIFIEGNLGCPGQEIIENCNSPLFGELSDEVFLQVAKH